MQTLEKRWYHYNALYKHGGLARMIAERLYFIVEVFHACEIPLQVNIGKNIRFGHRGIGIVIHKDCVIGDDVWIMQNVTLGAKGGHAPVIGNNVLIGAGAVILGGVIIGDRAIIGANAFVNRNVESDDIVGGIPAKSICKV